MDGWIKIHRKILEWEWYDDSKVVHLFIHCLLKANHKPKKWRGQHIDSGQFITSYQKLSEQLPLSVMQIRTALNKLKSTGELTIKTSNKYTMISITYWNDYQLTDKQDDNQITIKYQSNNNQITTNKNDNNNNNKNIYTKFDFSSWPEMPDEQIMKDWVAFRKSIKASVSQTVINRFGKQLTIARDKGLSVNDCLAQCVTKSWRGFEATWMKDENKHSYNGSNNQDACDELMQLT